MIRFVFDTNTIVSALLFDNSVPRRAFDRALDGGTILVSDSLVMELSRVLGRERFDQYVSLEERNEFLVSLIRESNLIEITESVQACRDPDDDRILELAINGARCMYRHGRFRLAGHEPVSRCGDPDTGRVPPLVRSCC